MLRAQTLQCKQRVLLSFGAFLGAVSTALPAAHCYVHIIIKEHHCEDAIQSSYHVLQLQLVHAAQESPEATNSVELVEPTLVLQLPLQAASGMHHSQAAACATDTSARVQDSTLTAATAQQPTLNTGSDCGTAQDCSQIGAFSKHSTAAQPEHVTVGHIMPAHCLQPAAAVSRCEAGGAERQRSDVTQTDGNVFSSSEQPRHEPIAVADGQDAGPEGQATVPGGQTTAPEGQYESPEGQTVIADGQAAKTDGQGATMDEQTALADGALAVSDDTVSEACCVCKFAEDGEVMLLCDKCDQPAHLGCVGVDAVPEGDWFCPSCTAAMVSISPLCSTQICPHPAISQHHIRWHMSCCAQHALHRACDNPGDTEMLHQATTHMQLQTCLLQ